MEVLKTHVKLYHNAILHFVHCDDSCNLTLLN